MASARFIRRLAIALAGGVIAIVAAVAVALRLAGPALVQPVLVDVLERQGFGPVQLTVERVGLAGLRIADLRLGAGGAIRASAVDVALSPARLMAGRVDQVALSGLRLAARVDAAGQVSIAGLPATSPTGASAGLPPIDRIVLDDAELAAATPLGATTLRLDGTVSLSADGVAADTRLDARLGGVTVRVATLRLATRGDGGWHVDVAGAGLGAPSLGLAADAIDATLEWTGGRATVTASAGRIRDTRTPARIVPLAARGRAERNGDAVSFELTAHDAAGRLEISAKGRHALGAGRGSTHLAVTPHAFAAGQLQPRDLAPALDATLPPIDGTVAIAGTAAWSRAGITPQLTVTLADLGMTLGGTRIAGGHGTIALDGLTPPSTPPDQRLSATVALGATALPLELMFALRRDGALAVSSMTLGFADGQLAVRDVVIPAPAPGAPPADLALPVHVLGTDLATLLQLAAVDGLSGSGRLDGTLPLRLIRHPDGSRGITLDPGHLDARGPGVLRYVGSALPTPSGRGGEAVALLRNALKDFHYDSLSLELAHRADGADDAVLHLTGANPAVLNGRRFVLNIRLDADFERLLSILLSGLDAAGRLTHGLVAPTP